MEVSLESPIKSGVSSSKSLELICLDLDISFLLLSLDKGLFYRFLVPLPIPVAIGLMGLFSIEATFYFALPVNVGILDLLFLFGLIVI